MSKEFIIGEVYFSLEFVDQDFKFPVITSSVFVGKNLDENQSKDDLWYFQDPESYFASGAFDGTREELPEHFDENREADGQVYVHQENMLANILTIPELIEDLRRYERGLIGAPPED